MSPNPVTVTEVKETETFFKDREEANNEAKKAAEHEKRWKNSSNKFLIWEFGQPLKWSNIYLIAIFHLVTLYTVFTHDYIKNPWPPIYASVLWAVSGFSVTAGAHRLWSHKSYKAKLPLRVLLVIGHCMAGLNSIIEWVRDHRVHHKFSETEADPHDAKRGFFYSHVGWLMMRKHPQVTAKGKLVDMSDIYADPLIVFQHKYHGWLQLLFCYAIPTIIPMVFWGETFLTSFTWNIARNIIGANVVWSVNSAAHLWGARPFDSRINPAENLFVSFFALGEGYHNYHHTFPWDYRASEIGMRLNPTTFWLDQFQKIGWAYEMKVPSRKLIENTAQKFGDGSYVFEHHPQEVPYEENEKLEKAM